MRKEQVNGTWYWVTDNYPNPPYNMTLIGSVENPAPGRVITAVQLWFRLYYSEQIAFMNSSAQKVKWFLFTVGLPGVMISLDDPNLVDALADAEIAGLIGAGRAAEILA